jgi:hypothetical protein
MNGDVCSAECELVLYQYSARERNWFQRWGQACAKQRRWLSTHWLTCSVWPSVSGWYVELICSSLPSWEKRQFQNLLVNIGSCSHISTLVRPWSLTTWSIKMEATLEAEKGRCSGIKWAYDDHDTVGRARSWKSFDEIHCDSLPGAC